MLGLLFPGQGAQRVGMGKALCDAFSEARLTMTQADEVLGFRLSKICFEGPEDELKLTKNCQPAILALSVAVWRSIEARAKTEFHVAAGHSLGEYGALVCAGALTFEDALRLVRRRGELMQDAVPVGLGAMAAVMGLETALVEDLCSSTQTGGIAVPANYNGPKQVVISGHLTAVEAVLATVRSQGGLVKWLPVSAPFHCPLMEPAASALWEVLASIAVRRPEIPVVSNVTAAPYASVEEIRRLLTRQIVAPVRWADTMAAMKSMGAGEYLEVGPGHTLASLAKHMDTTLSVRSIETPEQVEDLNWTIEPGKRVRKDGLKIVWDDGVVWDFNDPDAHGF